MKFNVVKNVGIPEARIKLLPVEKLRKLDIGDALEVREITNDFLKVHRRLSSAVRYYGKSAVTKYSVLKHNDTTVRIIRVE